MSKIANKFNSFNYWEQRYSQGGNSGNGSYGKLARFKTEVINNFIKEYDIKSVLDFGCGDGHQASFFNCQKYIGFDTSKTAIELCKEKFKTDTTKIFTRHRKELRPVDLTLSCEVLFHLVESDIFLQYLYELFAYSNKFVIIYSSNSNSEDMPPTSCHIKHRNFTSIVKKHFLNWELFKRIPNAYPKECFSDFFIYIKSNTVDIV